MKERQESMAVYGTLAYLKKGKFDPKELEKIRKLLNQVFERIAERPWIPEKDPKSWYDPASKNEFKVPSYRLPHALFSIRNIHENEFEGLRLAIAASSKKELELLKYWIVPIMKGHKDFSSKEFFMVDRIYMVPELSWEEVHGSYCYAEELLDLLEKNPASIKKDVHERLYKNLLNRLGHIRKIGKLSGNSRIAPAVLAIQDHLVVENQKKVPCDVIMHILEATPLVFPEAKEIVDLNNDQQIFCNSLETQFEKVIVDLGLVRGIIEKAKALENEYLLS